MPILRAFTEHPASVGESYTEHLAFASKFGGGLMWAGLACVLHGVFPFLFKKTGSDCVRALHAKLESCPARSSRAHDAPAPSGGAIGVASARDRA